MPVSFDVGPGIEVVLTDPAAGYTTLHAFTTGDDPTGGVTIGDQVMVFYTGRGTDPSGAGDNFTVSCVESGWSSVNAASFSDANGRWQWGWLKRQADGTAADLPTVRVSRDAKNDPSDFAFSAFMFVIRDARVTAISGGSSTTGFLNPAPAPGTTYTTTARRLVLSHAIHTQRDEEPAVDTAGDFTFVTSYMPSDADVVPHGLAVAETAAADTIDAAIWDAPTGTLRVRRQFLEVVDLAPPVPVAAATPTAGKTPLTVAFSSAGTADPDGTIVSYAWDFDDGGTSTSANPSHAFTSAGTYDVTLTVTDNDGLTGSDTVTVTVTDPQPPVAVIGATPTSGSDPLTVAFTSSGSSDPDGTIVSVEWDFGDGSPTSATANPSHQYTDDGTYTVTLTVTDDDDLTDDATVEITVNPVAPTAVATADPSTGDVPLEVEFDGSASTAGSDGGSIVSYSWDFDDGSDPDVTASPTHTFNLAGEYDVVLTVTDDDGLTDTATVHIIVTEPDFPSHGSWRVPLHRKASTRGFTQRYTIESEHPM